MKTRMHHGSRPSLAGNIGYFTAVDLGSCIQPRKSRHVQKVTGLPKGDRNDICFAFRCGWGLRLPVPPHLCSLSSLSLMCPFLQVKLDSFKRQVHLPLPEILTSSYINPWVHSDCVTVSTPILC